MAGHSHFKNIKRKKEAEDRKKSSTFSRLSKLIISSVREKGKDTEQNPSLKKLIEKAKEADMPKENIERAIKRGAGEGEEGRMEEFLFEVYGPENVAFLIKGTTDNKNRSLEEIRSLLRKHEAKIVDPGSLKWLFDSVGIIEVEKENESTALSLIEEGVEDLIEEDDIVLVYAPPKQTEGIKRKLEEKGINVPSSKLGYRAKTFLTPSGEEYKKLYADLSSCEDVEDIYINASL